MVFKTIKSMPESPNVQWTSAISFTKTGVDAMYKVSPMCIEC